MVKFTYEGNEYRIHFYYERDKQNRRVVNCIIKKNLLPILHGRAVTAREDVFVKAVGRKIALARALEDNQYDNTSKAFRAVAWSAYKTACALPT